MTRRALWITAVSFALVAPLSAQCFSGPADDPAWQFCVRSPGDSTPPPNGSGLELYDVRYRGTTVLRQGHIPILNVKYEPGGCGGGSLCYRDWFDQEQRFECPGAEIAPGICGASTPSTTVCENPGSDVGSFFGVAIEDYGDHLRLISQCSAGWYRYIPSWELWADGTIRALMTVSAVDSGCVAYDHVHHAYFRFDFDVDGPEGDFVDVVGAGGATRVGTEASWVDVSPQRRRWIVGTEGSDIYLEVQRNEEDGAAGDVSPVPDDFPIADGWLLGYHPDELTDDSGGLFDCPANLDAYLDGEDVDGADLVLWSRAGAFHEGEPGGISMTCFVMGPTIRVRLPEIFEDGFESGDAQAW